MPSPRHFPPPWTAAATDACFIVRDANGQALAYGYFEGERKLAPQPAGSLPSDAAQSYSFRSSVS
jgi:hypothetical protein